MNCKNCNSPMGPNDKFCTNCGNKREAIPESNVDVSLQNEDILQQSDLLEQPQLCSEDKNDELITETAAEEVQASADESNACDIGKTLENNDIVQPMNNTVIQNTNKNNVKTNGKSVIAKVISGFLCIVLAVFVVATVAVAVVQNALSSNSIANMISSIELDEIKIDDIADKEELEAIGLKCESDNVLDIIYDNINQTDLADPLTKSEFQDIVNNDEFSEYIGKTIEENFENVIEGKTDVIISVDDICGFLEKEDEFISDVVGYEITEERIENLRTVLEESYSEVFVSLDIKALDDTIGDAGAMTVIIAFSDWVLIALIIFDVLLAILIFLILHSFRLGFLYCGITSSVVGLIYTLPAVVLAIGSGIFFNSSILGELISQIMGVAVTPLLITSLSLFGLGLLMLIISLIINKFKNKKMA